MDSELRDDGEQPVEIPVDGVLDLHTFRPKDVKPVVLDYIELCRERGIHELRIIHGKGIGQLRATVHALLATHPYVHSYGLASEAYGGTGATIVRLQGCAGETRR
jgi:DNA-nicking Smr family endonuclease